MTVQPDRRSPRREKLRVLLLDRYAASHKWLETVALTGLFPACALLLEWPDPLLVSGGTPWLLFVPLLVGGQHGLRPALLSAALLSVGAALQLYSVAEGLPSSWYASGTCFLLTALLSGHFSGKGREQNTALREKSELLSNDLEVLTRAHRLLQISHGRLEERLAASDWSLATVVDRAHRTFDLCQGDRQVYSSLLDVLAGQAHIQAAAFFVLKSSQSFHASLCPKPVATLGGTLAASSGHPVVRQALRERVTAVLEIEELDLASRSQAEVLAAVPVETSQGQLLGIVAIYEMPFLAFQSDNISALTVIVRELADRMDERINELRKPAPIAELGVSA